MSTQLDRAAVWEMPNEELHITYFDRRDMENYGFTDEDAFIQWYTDRLKKGKYAGLSFTLVQKKDVPTDKTDRDCWSLKGKKVEVDQAKVIKRQERIAKKQATLNKLGVTKEDLKEALKD